MKIEKFEDIISWQKGQELTIQIYSILKSCKDYSYRDQIQRAVMSICNNIAEGFERRSNKELKQFLFIAKGSCAEVRSMLYMGEKLNYFTEYEFHQCYNSSIEISKLISGLLKTL